MAFLLPLAFGCTMASADGVDGQSSPIVYGADDRKELYEVDSAAVRARVAEAMVAFVPKRHLVRTTGGRMGVSAASFAQKDLLCPEERFGEQPAAAFCSGVLVDWDLVVTSGHCARVWPLEDFSVVFGYFYAAPAALVFDENDVVDPKQIVAESWSTSRERPRIDHAWLRLSRPVEPPRKPAPVHRSVGNARAGDPFVFVGAGGGVPMKVDRGASIAELGEPWFDFFVANTDSLRGASGGGAFDPSGLALLAVLERGGTDYAMTERGCRASVRVADGVPPEEELTFTARAVDGLCSQQPEASSLCRVGCGDPCAALPRVVPGAAASCSWTPGGVANGSAAPIPVVLLLFCYRNRRVRLPTMESPADRPGRCRSSDPAC
jgi:hypothetical protein